MKNLDRSFIDDLLSRIDIVEVISQSVELKKHGSGHKGLCPFHAENTPSFNVSSSKQFYHCFGCGASGDAITFLREYEGLTFMEAIEKLAAMANIEIPKSSNIKIENNTGLIDVNILTQNIFVSNLMSDENAMKYLNNRNISDEMIKHFGIGFAKDSWDQITNLLKSKNKLAEGLELGLLVKNNNKVYDRFRNRIMFPIKNTSGKIIAFGGRALKKDEKAKYINSPESKLFFKSAEIYGLSEAKQDINKEDEIIIVEGYTDVIALHKNNFKNTVATLGTAFTKLHINKLIRYSKNIIFCFDGDIAGKKAAWKALTNSLSEIRDTVNIGFSFIDNGQDPDQLCNENPKEFKKLIKKNTPLSEFMFESLSKNIDLNKVEGKTKFVGLILPLIEQLPKGLYKKLLLEKLSDLTHLSKDEFLDNKRNHVNKNSDVVKDTTEINSTDSLILSIFLEHPGIFAEFEDKIVNIVTNKEIKEMLQMIPTMKNGNKYYINRFLDSDDNKKQLFLRYSSEKIIYEDEESAKKTVHSIFNNLDETNKESQYLEILEKYSNGEVLTPPEKEILKNFKK